ncbi:hypothetical protein GCM10023196_098900 [Actinoallomurus vinaceus]|uniref:Uncharacterized protein n=1 Tax=Actinoallomurus vinaceus TaxID=1080074 RepID=A0ABP8UTB4_9ACTN
MRPSFGPRSPPPNPTPQGNLALIKQALIRTYLHIGPGAEPPTDFKRWQTGTRSRVKCETATFLLTPTSRYAAGGGLYGQRLCRY